RRLHRPRRHGVRPAYEDQTQPRLHQQRRRVWRPHRVLKQPAQRREKTAWLIVSADMAGLLTRAKAKEVPPIKPYGQPYVAAPLRRRTKPFAPTAGDQAKPPVGSLPPSKPPTGPAPPRRSVCAPGEVAVTILQQTVKETQPMRFSFVRDFLTPVWPRSRRVRRRLPTARARLRLETLEDRCLL